MLSLTGLCQLQEQGLYYQHHAPRHEDELQIGNSNSFPKTISWADVVPLPAIPIRKLLKQLNFIDDTCPYDPNPRMRI